MNSHGIVRPFETGWRVIAVLAILATALAVAAVPVEAQQVTSISGSVWSDLDGDGVRDGGEPGLEGVVVVLSGNGPGRTTTSASNGEYSFDNLLPLQNLPSQNQYVVQAVAPEHTMLTTVGGHVFPFGQVRDNENADFGFQPDRTASISGLLWSDLDGDQTIDLNEPGIAGVDVLLVDNGTPVIETTDQDGRYEFTGLRQFGNFRVMPVSAPQGMRFGPTAYVWTGQLISVDTQDVDFHFQPIPPNNTSTTTTMAPTTTTMAPTTTTTAPPAGVLVCNDLEVTVDMADGEMPTAGDDVIRGTAGNDVIDGLGGDDTICGLQGDDSIDGGDGFDKIFAGAGGDTLDGGPGNDLLIGGSGNDSINGGNGNDRIQGGDGSDILQGDNGQDRISGGNGNDTLRGGAFADQLFGNLGRDQLFGDAGADVLRGGAWLDEMDGGSQQDGCTLTDPAGLVEVRVSCETGVFGL